MPFRIESVGTVASPNLPARKGILALRHAHPVQAPKLIGGSGLSDGFPGQPSAPPPRVTDTAAAPSTGTGDGWLCDAGMTHLTDMSARHATDRLADWQIALRAENKSPGTVAVYADGATRYLRWCAEGDHRPMSRAALNLWIAGLLDAGAAPGTARIRQLAVRRFASWLTAGGEIHTDPFPGVKAPRVEPPIVEPLTDDELRALIATCAVPNTAADPEDTLHHRRDEAIIRLMFETAIRSGEVIDLQLDDVDIVGRLITIRRGKGGRGRGIPMGQATTEALLRYLGERERHPLAAFPRSLVGQPRQAVRPRRAHPFFATPSRARRGPRFPAPPAPAHRRAPLARSRRLRIRTHGRRRLDPHRHARPLHPSPRLRTSRGGSPQTQPRGALSRC
jgi:site-specific recombinase XerD